MMITNQIKSDTLQSILEVIISKPILHAKWLNTLSFMENIGARKISKFEHRTETNLTILKHAAEEARHAYFLKKQISKIGDTFCPTYQKDFILAPNESFDYLTILDIEISRYLKKIHKLTGNNLKFGSYLLTTYAIEIRANDIYLVYQNLLTKLNSEINVKSIIQEEIGHLDEMERIMSSFLPNKSDDQLFAIQTETILYNKWIRALADEIISN